MTTDLETMADKADHLYRELTTPATVVLVRACLNEAGITTARRALTNALDNLAVAQEAKRSADRAERDAKEGLDRALVDVEWGLTAPDANEAGAKLLADDKKAWKRREALADPAVIGATKTLRDAEHASAVARDSLTMTDLRLKATRADLDAAIATLNALCLALPSRKETP